MQAEGPLFIFIHQPSICISTAKPKQGMVCYLNLSCPSDILVRALSTAQYMNQKHKNVLHLQHHKVNSLTKSQNASIQHTFERRWEGKTIHMSSRLGNLHSSNLTEKQSDTLQKSQSPSSLSLRFITKEWTTFGDPTFGKATPPCRKQKKGRELGWMLRVSPGTPWTKTKNWAETGGYTHAKDRVHSAQRSWPPRMILRVLLLKVQWGYTHSEFSRTKSPMFYTALPKSQIAKVTTALTVLHPNTKFTHLFCFCFLR